MLMSALVCACWAAVTSLCTPLQGGWWGRRHVPTRACLFYFPCCLTCGWLIAFTALTLPGAWLSRWPPWRVCVCVCIRVCLRPQWVFDPLLSPPPRRICFYNQSHDLCTNVTHYRAESSICNGTHLTTSPRHWIDNKHVDAVTRLANKPESKKTGGSFGFVEDLFGGDGFKRNWVTASGLQWSQVVFSEQIQRRLSSTFSLWNALTLHRSKSREFEGFDEQLPQRALKEVRLRWFMSASRIEQFNNRFFEMKARVGFAALVLSRKEVHAFSINSLVLAKPRQRRSVWTK